MSCNLGFPCSEAPLGPSLADVCSGSMFISFMTLLNTLANENEKISGRCERLKPVETPYDKYDFVVVGGGAAGAVVAARLSEIYKWKVLLLEAGPDEAAGSQIPSFTSLFLTTGSVWNYTSTNEEYACLGTGGSCPFPSGKSLGGNTAQNGMWYLRGNPTDYNNWAKKGNVGWTWKEVEPYFMKSEDNGEIERVGRKHHGTCGPLSVERFPYMNFLGNSVLAAASEIGYGVSEDLNGDKLTGCSQVQTTSNKGVRRSSARAFLWPVRHRENLHVSLNSTVTRIIIENRKAVGVEYFKEGKLRTVYVEKEVIVSGGAIESPHLLLLSGIGPKEHLESMDVKVVLDLPGVGENLHDHPGAPMTFTINDTDVYDNNYKVAEEYFKHQTGPMSSYPGAPVTGFLASNGTPPDYPDIQLYFSAYTADCAPGEVGALRSDGLRSIIAGAAYFHPKSRGNVTLASNDPFELPVIHVNYLSEPNDLERIVEGLKMVLAMLDTNALRGYGFNMSTAAYQACSGYQFRSDEYLACLAKQYNFALYHLVGTCKMGPSSDPMAVVDPRLRVHGIKGLRVADASIMPKVPSCNTAAPTMMIGERAADFIKEDWDQKTGERSCYNGMNEKMEPDNECCDGSHY